MPDSISTEIRKKSVLAAVPKLYVLQLEHNNIKEIPSEIGDLLHLEQLRFGCNKLTMLPPELGRLKNLKDLNLEV